MSVVAWDGKTLAADRQCLYADTITTIKKLWQLKNGDIIAHVGTTCSGLTMKSWYEAGAKKEDWPECQKGDNIALFIVVSAKTGKCVFYETEPEPIEVLDQFRAWGTGRECAMGAMAMGADAVKAVEIASKYIVGCGNGVDYASFNPCFNGFSYLAYWTVA